jgi:hypothetical protein
MNKFFVIVRADIDPGLQLAQACHAAMAWQAEHGFAPENIAVLSARDEKELIEIAARTREARAVLFHEIDLNDAATALALGPEAKRFVRELPLALRSADRVLDLAG